MISYLLDANVFIQAKRFHYPFDIFPGYWEWLDREMTNGIISSIVPIYDELAAGDDSLSEWAVERKDTSWFLPVDDEDTQTEYSNIAAWIVDEKQEFKQSAIAEYFSVGDSWLVAKAASARSVIVTHEKFDARCKKRILIPNVCREFNIECINTVELIRRTGAVFKLQ